MHQPQLHTQSDAKLQPLSQAKASPDRATLIAAPLRPNHAAPLRSHQDRTGSFAPRSHRDRTHSTSPPCSTIACLRSTTAITTPAIIQATLLHELRSTSKLPIYLHNPIPISTNPHPHCPIHTHLI